MTEQIEEILEQLPEPLDIPAEPELAEGQTTADVHGDILGV